MACLAKIAEEGECGAYLVVDLARHVAREHEIACALALGERQLFVDAFLPLLGVVGFEILSQRIAEFRHGGVELDDFERLGAEIHHHGVVVQVCRQYAAVARQYLATGGIDGLDRCQRRVAHMIPVLGVYYGGLEQIHGNSHGGGHAEGKDQREAPYGILLFGTLFFFSRHRYVGF